MNEKITKGCRLYFVNSVLKKIIDEGEFIDFFYAYTECVRYRRYDDTISYRCLIDYNISCENKYNKNRVFTSKVEADEYVNFLLLPKLKQK